MGKYTLTVIVKNNTTRKSYFKTIFYSKMTICETNSISNTMDLLGTHMGSRLPGDNNLRPGQVNYNSRISRKGNHSKEIQSLTVHTLSLTFTESFKSIFVALTTSVEEFQTFFLFPIVIEIQ